MTWLDNPITQMWGPYFLALYAMVFGLLLALILWHRRRVDQSMELGNLSIPLEIDPYQLAYLRGGPPEVLRLATVDLYQRGLIVDSMPDSSRAKRLHLLPEADLTDLDPPLRAVAGFYRTPRQPAELVKSGRMIGFEETIATWDQWIESERLHHTEYTKASHHALQMVMLAGYLSLGIFKLVTTPKDGVIDAEQHELAFAHMIEYLFPLPHAEALAAAQKIGQYVVLFFGISFGLVFGITGFGTEAQLPRFTERGRRFINNLQTVFASLKRPKSTASASSRELRPGKRTDSAILTMALFGVEALQGGALDAMYEHFVPSAEQGSSCGPGCGSGDGGGGCGGCGGGGCGCGG